MHFKRPGLIMRSDSQEKLNLLAAYPYLTNPMVKQLTEVDADVRLLVDSGAFTAWKAGTTIKLDDYCRFIEALPVKPWRYFTLDVVGDPEASMQNYQMMLDRGFNPVPIFTRGEDPSVIDDYYKTSDVVGIGGLVGTRRNKGFINGIMEKIGNRRCHWLGFTSANYMKHYKPYMCDSSSWAGALRFGQISLYAGNGRFVKCSKQDFMKKPGEEIRRLVRWHGVDPRELAKGDQWKNSGSGKYPTEKIAFRSFVKYQSEVGENLGTKLFMAVASDWQAKLAVQAAHYWRKQR